MLAENNATLDNSNAVLAQISSQSPENRLQVRGRPWQPGQSGNPGGRPKARNITDAYKAILAEKGAESLAEVVYNDAITAKNPRDRLSAVQEITDRVEGKAIQAHRIEATIDDNSGRRLGELVATMAAFLGIQDEPQTIEGDTITGPCLPAADETSGTENK